MRKFKKWLKKKLGILEIEEILQYTLKFEERIRELENFIDPLKGQIETPARSREIERVKRWLNGYPDETRKR